MCCWSQEKPSVRRTVFKPDGFRPAGTTRGRLAALWSCGWTCWTFSGVCRRRRRRWRAASGGMSRGRGRRWPLCRTVGAGGRTLPVLYPVGTSSCGWDALETSPQLPVRAFSSCTLRSWPCTTAEVDLQPEALWNLIAQCTSIPNPLIYDQF